MEEGRVRLNAPNHQFFYDYMLKDHLGNVRMVLTDEEKTTAYPPASMEPGEATNEEVLFSRLPQTRVDRTTISGYPSNDTYTHPNDYVAKTLAADKIIGPAQALKVMSGDHVNLRVTSWYQMGNTTPANSYSDIADDLVSVMTTQMSGLSGKVTPGQLGYHSTGLVPGAVLAFLDQQESNMNQGKPVAALNWILLDEQFRLVSSSSGADQIGDDEEFKVHLQENLLMEKSGYLFVYVSNASTTVPVYWDNLQVTHSRGTILEETHYYPFGLVMAGISSKAASFGGAENKKKYNGIEKEDDLEINVYDAQFRELDAQTGRWWQIDPVTDGYENLSPYASMYNNPLTYSDPLGDEGDACCWDWIVEKSQQAANYVGGFIVGAGAAAVDNATGSNIRGQLGKHFEGRGAAAYGFNHGQDAADAGAIVIGAAEVIGGGGTAGGGTLVTVGSGGTTSVVTVPISLGGAAVMGHGLFMVNNGADNLIHQNGRVNTGSESSSGSGKTNKNNVTDKSNPPGRTASGHPTDQHGNKLGPSSKPQVNTVNHSTQKRAKDAARAEGKAAPVKHTNPQKGGNHYHPTDKKGNKVPNSTHHEY